MTHDINLVNQALDNGDISQYEKLTGKQLIYKSRVVHGQKRGRRMGFPTINQQLSEEDPKPKFGVYATIVIIDNKEYYGVTNVGIRPTFALSTPNSETYIIDYDGDLYDDLVSVRLVKFIRPERKFNGLDDLQNQIENDKESVKKYFNLPV